MRLVDINVDRFGVLKNASLEDLSPGMTVVYGGNGSGKTTLVSFLRGLLFGYTTDHQGFQVDDSHFGGNVSLKSQGRSLRLSRECNHGISSDLSTKDLASSVAVTTHATQLAPWINETVHQEIFSVGYQEAARFDLLTRLCLDGEGATGNEEEMRRTELAISECVREREGDGVQHGLRQKMADVQRQRDDLRGRLAEMRRVDPTIPPRIAELELQLKRLAAFLAEVEQKITDCEAQIRQLEEVLEQLRRRNVVTLDRRAIEERINSLSQRQQRWASIRESVQRELSGIDGRRSISGSSTDSLTSVRALVARLEQRMDSLLKDGTLQATSATGVNRDLFIEHLRSEVFSLCEHVSHHEAAVQSHEASLESLLAERTLHDADNVDAVIQGQIDALKEELVCSENVLDRDVRSVLTCDSHSHAEFFRPSQRTVHGSVEEIEAQLITLRRRLSDLHRERQSTVDQVRQLEVELAELRLKLKATARLEDIDRVKMQIAQLDAEFELLQQRYNVQQTTEANLRTVLERLRNYRNPGVLELASEYVDRLTDGDCHQLIADSTNSHILAETRQSSHPQKLQQLSRGTRDLAALALRLALIQCRAEDAERCPLILDDVFITADDDAAEAAADLLMDVAADGQQIIFFTCQKDVRELFARRDASVRYLNERPAVAPRVAEVPQPVISAPTPPPVVQPAPKPAPTSDHTNWLFYLEVDNSVEDLSGLTVAEVEAFRASDIETIDELLTMSVDELEARFRQRGYSISRDRIRAWRGQAELASQIPMLRRSDAELLYAAGIQSTVELSRMRPETVFDVVTTFQDTQAGSRFRRSSRSIDRQQAINWSRWSQHSRSLSEARRSRSRFFVGSGDSDSSGRGFDRSSSRLRSRRARISESGTVVRKQRRPSLSTEARRKRDDRQNRRRQRMTRHSSSYRTTKQSNDTDTDTDRELKFYLNRSDDVEAAPSIGPKTAQRLARVGIYTVDDLLNAHATDVADRLDNRRISADTILEWQGQARMVCLVPGLRGHDAQILVACGVTEPEQLAAKRAADLFAIVGPFADTSEGERIVRGGRKPDLEEVTDWISWAQNSRSLSAAA
ncbi:DUF4332 domain-containing protein [Fuerstiella marisgermanici]|uniref:Chromosome segregation protein n=1 Tax=Fuerstiella marisgermanici TaxID=1891926 RepID=A0A1P8WS08_9PLAN|nr:DUF4332 domain-containing protein [Fuerstiella marisgermanici]APZ96844.1 chromosome segregation protein [Fuerstiella marisgermanici]